MQKPALLAILPSTLFLFGIADAATILNGPWAGGTVDASAHVILAEGASLTGDVTVNGTLQFSQTSDLTVSRLFYDHGSLLLTHSGTLTLTGSSGNITAYGLYEGPYFSLDTATIARSGVLRIGSSGESTFVIGGRQPLLGGEAALEATASLRIEGGSVISGTSLIGFGAPVYDRDYSRFFGFANHGAVTIDTGTWDCRGTLAIGGNARGTLALDKGTLYSREARIGNYGASGTAVVSSGTWINAGSLSVLGALSERFEAGIRSYVGGTSAFHLVGGFVQTQSAEINTDVSSNYPNMAATATVTGGTWSITNAITVQPASRLYLVAGNIYAASTAITASGTDAGEVVVRGGQYTNTVSLTVGTNERSLRTPLRPASLLIEGGVVDSASTAIGLGASGNGTVLLADGVLITRAALTMGTGTLHVLHGVATTDHTYLGRGLGSDSKLLVSGGAYATTNDSFIGLDGSGSFTVSDGSVTNRNCFLGYLADGRGTATITGGTWATRGSLHIGVGSLEPATVTARGGKMTALSAVLGSNAGSRGSMVISGGTFSTGSLFVGLNGDGVLAVNSGIATGTASFVGYGPGSTGLVDVSSGTWSNAAHLHVGFEGTGTLTLRGGSVVSTNGYIGQGYAGSGSVSVSSGTWSTTNLVVGGSGIAALDILGTGVVNVSGTLSAGEFGAISVRPGGTLRLGVMSSSPSTTITNDGTLVVDDSVNPYWWNLPTLTGNGELSKKGRGSLAIKRADSFDGTVNVGAGLLSLGGAAPLVLRKVEVSQGATLVLGNQATIDQLSLGHGAILGISMGMPSTVRGGLTQQTLREALAGGRIQACDPYQNPYMPPYQSGRTTGWINNGDGSYTIAYAASGDTNLDGAIDILDLGNFLSSGKLDAGSNASWSEGDFNYDGIVDIIDVSLFVSTGLFDRGSYVTRTPPLQVAVVPEPSVLPALSLAAATVIAVAMIRREQV